jgi:NADPH oxidase
MLPYAKGFGYALDFVAAVILFPVCRTFLRLLYNYSTQDQTATSRALRSVLYLFPLDKALHFHEKCGAVILFLSFGHSFAHLVNAGLKFPQVIAFYGWSPLISGFLLWVCIFFMFPATVPVVKRGQFEIFWYSHQLLWAFLILNLIHGRNTLGPHYYFAFILPGTIYVMEVIYREYSAYQSVSIVSITNMKNNVLSVEFSKSAFPGGYLEGQYCYIQCPKIAPRQWHPFTISSAPGDPTVTLHIKIQGKDSWTKSLLEYFTYLGPKNASYFELADSGANGVQIGKVLGPSGERMLRVYGPHSAPTQHAPEYTTDIIVGSGIGVTPVSATMQQTVFYRWKYNIGDSNPDHAYFAWVCNYNEIETFRWMIRTIKECQDEVYDLRLKNPDSMGTKNFEVHIWITSIPEDVKPPGNIEVDDDIGYWGRPRKPTGGVAKAPEQYSEIEIYKTMLYPPKGNPAELGDIRIYNGRPKWDTLFTTVSQRHLACKIGVAFCGNPRIGEDLKEMCTKYTNPAANQIFTLHKENF